MGLVVLVGFVGSVGLVGLVGLVVLVGLVFGFLRSQVCATTTSNDSLFKKKNSSGSP